MDPIGINDTGLTQQLTEEYIAFCEQSKTDRPTDQPNDQQTDMRVHGGVTTKQYSNYYQYIAFVKLLMFPLQFLFFKTFSIVEER